ncbi:MAG: hypothetical protein WA130_07295 [Candidatus Methanoperedens sp.]
MVDKDRWNLAKLKVLRTIGRLGDANSLMIAERTRKSVNATDRRLKDLLRFKHIKTIPYPHKNDGCCSRYQLTTKGIKYLTTLENRFLYSQDLNLKYNPMHIDYTPDTITWKNREYPPQYPEATGNKYDFNLSDKIKDAIMLGRKRELQFFTKEEKTYSIGDYFRIYDLDTYVLYYVERFTLQEYAKTFSRYRSPKDPEQYLLKLQADHPGSKYVYNLYFRKYKARPQEQTPDQRIAQFLSDKNPPNDSISNPIEHTPQQAYNENYYSLFERKIGEILNIKGIDYQVLETTPLPLGQMVDIEYQSHGYNSPEEYMTAWLSERNATRPTREFIVYRCKLQAIEKEG